MQVTRAQFEAADSEVPYWWEGAPPIVLTRVGMPASVDVIVAGAGFTGFRPLSVPESKRMAQFQVLRAYG